MGGWWRLWIVASVIYGAITVVFTWEQFPNVTNTTFEKGHLERLSDRTNLILAGRVQSPFPADTPKWARDPIILKMPNGHTFEVPGNTTSKQAEEVAKDYFAVLNSILKEHRLSEVLNAFLAWVIPCLVILALGGAVHWIYRGFRPREST
jgi:hypothetical protein